MIRRLGGFLAQDARTVVVAVVAASVVAGPTAAAIVANSDKVDGKHAVGAGATKPQRANKLVATNGAGMLPNNVIGKAVDADKLDGLDSSRLLPGGPPPPGTTMRGHYALGGYNPSASSRGYATTAVSYPLRLAAPPTTVRWVRQGFAAGPECPGTVSDPAAQPGYLCLYERSEGNMTNVNYPWAMQMTRQGFVLYGFSDQVVGEFRGDGTWAVTAP